MAKEIRVFVADETDFYRNIDMDSDIEDVMDCAEAIGTVFTLPNFIKEYNLGNINLADSNIILRMAVFEDNQFVEEIK